jgi:hypothetical protein
LVNKKAAFRSFIKMLTQFVSGDIFVNTYVAQTFTHVCNCQGSLGAVIAKVSYPLIWLQASKDKTAGRKPALQK